MYDLAVGRMSGKPRSSLPGFHDGERWFICTMENQQPVSVLLQPTFE